MTMNVILLSGGSGKRLWPLSNDVRSKQFLKVFKAPGSEHKESMAQRMYRMIKEVSPEATITLATSESQIPQIRTQLGEDTGISIEPCRRDTFPAIALAAAYLHDKVGVKEDEAVIICPVDPYVERDYFECLLKMSEEAVKGNANITLMGIEPTYPSEKYGYIIPADKNPISSVRSFKEKPDEKTAQSYIEQGALWNGGVFAFKLSYMLEKSRELLGSCEHEDLYKRYKELEKISFDYAVVEKEPSINVIRFAGSWKDLGTWNTITEAMDEEVSGKATASLCTNTHVINELGIPMVVLGVNDAVVAATPDGILVSDKGKSSSLKEYVKDARPMYERRPWGEYRVLDFKVHKDEKNSLVKELVIHDGQHISYQKHYKRTEIWTFTEGKGVLVVNDKKREVGIGDTVVISPGDKHGIKAVGGKLHIIEVQIGTELVEEDIERLDFDWEW